jgi:hypothetical protein
MSPYGGKSTISPLGYWTVTWAASRSGTVTSNQVAGLREARSPDGPIKKHRTLTDILILIGVSVGVGVGSLVGVAVGVDVNVGVGLGVAVGISVGSGVSVGVGVCVVVGVGVDVAVDVGVCVVVSVGLGACVAAAVGVAVDVGSGVSVGAGTHAVNIINRMLKHTTALLLEIWCLIFYHILSVCSLRTIFQSPGSGLTDGS